MSLLVRAVGTIGATSVVATTRLTWCRRPSFDMARLSEAICARGWHGRRVA